MSEHSYQFSQIFVTKPHEPTKLSDTTTLTFDKKDVYAGGKYRIKLKHLNALEQSITERDDYGGLSRGGRGYGSRGGYLNHGATTTKTLLLVLRSKHLEIQCSTNMGGTAKAVQALETFISGLKSAHRKQKIKHEETDPYAEEEKKKHNRIGGSSSKGGGHRSTTLSLGGGSSMNKGKNGRAALRTTQVTPAGQPVYMSSDRKRPTSGAFQSPAKNRPRRDNGGGERGSSGNYAHYDPALEEDDEDEDEVVGNVVVKEPVTKALFLPPKSPRNATPTKLRDEKEGNGKKVRTIANQLQGISGGNIKLKKKVDMEEYSDTDDDDDADDRKGKNQKSLSAFKRRKLQMSRMSGGDSDSDFETKKSSAKKRLHLSAKDEDEEESEDDDDGDNSLSSKDDKVPAYPETHTNKEPKSKSTADEALTPSPKKVPPKKGNITSFFSAKPAAAKKARSSSPTPGDTYGSSLSTPTKNPSKKNDAVSPSTPSTPPHRTEPTPVKPLSQRKGPSSRYFSNANFNVEGMATNKGNSGRNLFSTKDDEVEEDDIYGDTSEYYNENDENAAAIHQDEYDVYGKPTTAYSGIMNTNSRRPGVYGRAGRSNMMAQARSRMGRARLGPQHQNQFSSYAAGSRPTKNPYTAKKQSQSSADWALSSKRYDSPPPSRMSHMPDLVNNDPPAKNIPGIQNLGNTCYLSASLQTLFSIPQFIADLYKTYDSQSLTGKKMPLTKALLEVATAIGVLSEEDAKDIDPEAARQIWLNKMAGNPVALKKQMDVLTDKFAGYEQRECQGLLFSVCKGCNLISSILLRLPGDAHEFLSDLVDYLHDELAAPLMPPAEETASAQTTEASTTTKAGEGGRTSRLENKDPNEEGKEKEDKGTAAKTETSATEVQHDHGVLPTDEFFHLNVRVCLTCDSCGYSRSKDEMYRHLSVDVGIDSDIDKCTVQRSLQQFFQPEMRELKCEKCDAGKTATQTMEIISWLVCYILC